MARPRKSEVQISDEIVNSMVKKEDPVTIEEMPLTSLGDYMRYNDEARKMNKKLRILRYPIKQCPVDLHPMERIVFGRNDQPTNPLPVFLSNDMIHFDRSAPRDRLIPGKTYDLPRCVVEYLASKGTPVWAWFENADGSRETRMVSKTSRFSLRTIYAA